MFEAIGAGFEWIAGQTAIIIAAITILSIYWFYVDIKKYNNENEQTETLYQMYSNTKRRFKKNLFYNIFPVLALLIAIGIAILVSKNGDNSTARKIFTYSFAIYVVFCMICFKLEGGRFNYCFRSLFTSYEEKPSDYYDEVTYEVDGSTKTEVKREKKMTSQAEYGFIWNIIRFILQCIVFLLVTFFTAIKKVTVGFLLFIFYTRRMVILKNDLKKEEY